MNKTIYRWFLSADQGETEQRAFPIYKDDLSIDYEIESGQQFHRAKISGKIDFVGEDYDWIMAQNLSTQTINVYLRVSFDNLSTEALYWHGYFTLTDMEVDADNRRIIVQPKTSDRYTVLLDNLETEYDLIKDLAPSKSKVNLVKGAYMQVLTAKGLTSSYLYNDYVDDIRGLDSFQEECSEEATSTQQLTDNYHFGVIGNAMSMILSKSSDNNGQMPSINADGTYVGMYNSETNSAELYCPETDYYISYQTTTTIPTTQTIQLHNSNGVVLYADIRTAETPIFAYQRTLTLLAIESTMVGRFLATTQGWNMHGRLMTDTNSDSITIDGETYNLNARPMQDITPYSLNYKKIATLQSGYMAYVAISARTSEEEIPNKTIYGRNPNGEYWLPPTDNQLYMPISQTTWQGKVSLWVYALGNNIEVEDARKGYSLNDAYLIADVISALLEKVAPDVRHQATTEYSQFLYGVNPISQTNERLFLTPKSNVLTSEYSQAAQKGVITLKMVLDMLAKVYQCYWWVDNGNRLRIEHISYIAQGNSYTSGNTASVSVDLTTLLNNRNAKAWSFGKNNWTYNKEDMPERILFKWMDEGVGSVFAGQPIILQSPFIEKAKKEEQSISNFTSDIDRMLIVPGEFSRDGFALITATSINDSYVGNIYTFDAGDYKSLKIATTVGTDVRIVVECSNTSDQPQPIEFGWMQNSGALAAFNKRGDVASASEPVRSEISIIAPMDTFYLYFSSLNSGYTNSVKIISIYGGVEYDVNMETRYNGGITYDVQNYHLSLEWLLPMFWKYNLPVTSASFNGESATQTYLPLRCRQQSVKVPFGNSLEPSPELLIRTDIGDGKISKMSVSLSSRVGSATLLQATTDYEEPIIVTPPTLSVASGEVTLNTQLTIGISGDAVSAEYSNDGETWTEYSQPIVLTQDVTIYARAKDGNGNVSEVVSAEYEVLPYEAQVEYLGFTGTQYIDTGLTLKGATQYDFSMDFMPTRVWNYNAITSQNTVANESWIDAGGNYYFRYSNVKSTGTKIYANERALIRIVLENNTFTSYKNDVVFSTNNANITTDANNLWIFKRATYGEGLLYAFFLSLNGVDSIDLIPVRVGTTGYMYDRVSKTLFGNAGTGDFTLGGDV